MTLEAAGSPAVAQAPEGSAPTTTAPESPVRRYEPPEPEPAPQEGQATEGDPAPQPEPADDSEEVEHEGQKYKVPKALKDAFLRQSDYTRKTQEVAEQRKALETQQAQLAERATANDQHLDRLATIRLIDHQLAQFPQNPQQWAQLEQQDPARAASLFRQMQQLQGTRVNLAQQTQKYQQDQAVEAQQATAKRAQEAVQVLQKAIPDFSEQTLQDIEAFAVKEFGVNPEQVRATVDPTIWLMGYKLMKAAAAVNAQIATATEKTKTEAKPAAVIKAGQAKVDPDPDKMSVEEWTRWRNDQLRARNRR